MTKEEFVKQINEIIELDKKCRQIAKMINDLFCAGSTASVVDLHYKVAESHVENIAQLSGIDKDWIEAFLWEDAEVGLKMGTTNSNEFVYIADAAELWDFYKEIDD